MKLAYNIASVALIVISLVYPVVVLTIFPKWVIDDAFITFRYADNFAKHSELTWNIGELPIEGYTGVALPVLLAGFIKLGFDPIDVSHAIGVSAYFLGWLMLLLVLRKLRINKLVSGLTLLFYSTTPIFFTHALSGLETMLFVATILASFYWLLRVVFDAENKKSSTTVFFLFSLVVGFVRPEGVAWAGFAISAATYVQFKHHRNALKFFAALFTIFYFVPAMIYFLWRWNYYGALLPNTYYAKQLASLDISLIVWISRFFRAYFAIPFVSVFLLILPAADWLWEKIKSKENGLWDQRLWPLISAVVAFMALLFLVYSRSHLTTNFSERFYVPFMPFFWIGLAYLLNLGSLGINQIKETKPVSYKLALFLLIVLSTYQIAFQIVKISGEMRFAREEKLDKEGMHYLAGKFLKETLSSSDWLVVYIDAGAIPYFSGMKTIDFGALNDSVLARRNLSLKERVEYFYLKNPAAAVFTSSSLDKVIYTTESDAITNDLRFQNYILAKKYISPVDRQVNWYELLFLRKDIYAKLK